MSLLRTGLLNVSRNVPLVHTKRALSLDPRQWVVVRPFLEKRPIGMPDPIEASIGNFKMELMLAEMGVTDPFLENPVYINGGTKEDPMLVLMLTKRRLVGCQCEPDQTYFNYMWIHEGEMKRCECGYWLKGVPIPNPQLYVVDKAFT